MAAISVYHSGSFDVASFLGGLRKALESYQSTSPGSTSSLHDAVFVSYKFGEIPQDKQPSPLCFIAFSTADRRDFTAVIKEIATSQKRAALFSQGFLVGTVSDSVQTKRVPAQEIIALAQKLGLQYVEIEADYNVLFSVTAAALAFLKIQQENASTEEPNGLRSISRDNSVVQSVAKEAADPVASSDLGRLGQQLSKPPPRQSVPIYASQLIQQKSSQISEKRCASSEGLSPTHQSTGNSSPLELPCCAPSNPIQKLSQDAQPSPRFHHEVPLRILVHFTAGGVRRCVPVALRLGESVSSLVQELSQMFFLSVQAQKALETQLTEAAERHGYKAGPGVAEKAFAKQTEAQPQGRNAPVAQARFNFGLKQMVWNVVPGRELQDAAEICRAMGLRPEAYQGFVEGRLFAAQKRAGEMEGERKEQNTRKATQ